MVLEDERLRSAELRKACSWVTDGSFSLCPKVRREHCSVWPNPHNITTLQRPTGERISTQIWETHTHSGFRKHVDTSTWEAIAMLLITATVHLQPCGLCVCLFLLAELPGLSLISFSTVTLSGRAMMSSRRLKSQHTHAYATCTIYRQIHNHKYFHSSYCLH